MSGPAQILGSRSRQRWPRAVAAAAGAAVLRRAARAVTTGDTDTRGHVCDIVLSAVHTRGSGTGPALTGVIDQGRSSKVGFWLEAVSK